jgi:hypothetical protein
MYLPKMEKISFIFVKADCGGSGCGTIGVIVGTEGPE